MVSGKCYHGQTINPSERWSHHFRTDSHCHALRAAIAKYGRDKFVFEVVGEASSKEELDALEIKWVATSLSPLGYNLKTGGSNGKPSAETRRKMSVSGKEAQNRPEVRAKNSAGVKLAMARPDVKARHREALILACSQPDSKARRRAKMLEVYSRPGEKEKRSAGLKASWAGYSAEERGQRIKLQKAGYTSEVRKKLSIEAAKRLALPEVKKRHKIGVQASMTLERLAAMSRRMKGQWAQPGEKEKRGRAIAQTLSIPEVKAKHSEAITKALSTPEARLKLARRRRRGESLESWKIRVGES